MLSLKPDYEETRQRIEAFWERQLLDRPVVQFTLYKPEAERRPLPVSGHTTPAGRWLDAEYQAEWALANLSNQLFLGDTLPIAWPNLGPDVFASFYGCPLEFDDSGTSWSRPILDDWSRMDEVRLDRGHPFLRRLVEMSDALLEVGRGHFLTDLHPGGDCLAALRGPQNLALDLLDHPAEVKALLARVEADFFEVYDLFYRRLRAAGMPITTWTPLLSEGRYYLPSNDFSILIGPQMFADFSRHHPSVPLSRPLPLSPGCTWSTCWRSRNWTPSSSSPPSATPPLPGGAGCTAASRRRAKGCR